jgi:hypothetical protein
MTFTTTRSAKMLALIIGLVSLLPLACSVGEMVTGAAGTPSPQTEAGSATVQPGRSTIATRTAVAPTITVTASVNASQNAGVPPTATVGSLTQATITATQSITSSLPTTLTLMSRPASTNCPTAWKTTPFTLSGRKTYTASVAVQACVINSYLDFQFYLMDNVGNPEAQVRELATYTSDSYRPTATSSIINTPTQHQFYPIPFVAYLNPHDVSFAYSVQEFSVDGLRALLIARHGHGYRPYYTLDHQLGWLETNAEEYGYWMTYNSKSKRWVVDAMGPSRDLETGQVYHN